MYTKYLFNANLRGPKFCVIVIALSIITNRAISQTFLNGNFENNSAGVCNFILSTASFNNTMANTVSFGSNSSIAIIDSFCIATNPQNGHWFINLKNYPLSMIGKLALELSSNLIAGNTYQITYFEKSEPNAFPNDTILIGLSSIDTLFGFSIHKSLPDTLGWSQKIFNFVAPITGKYITIQANTGPTSLGYSQTFLDNFSITQICPSAFSLGSDTTLCPSQIVKLTSSIPNASYVWQNSITNDTFIVNSSGN